MLFSTITHLMNQLFFFTVQVLYITHTFFFAWYNWEYWLLNRMAIFPKANMIYKLVKYRMICCYCCLNVSFKNISNEAEGNLTKWKVLTFLKYYSILVNKKHSNIKLNTPTYTNIDNKLRIPNVISNRQVFHLALKTIFFWGYYQQL